MPTPLSPDPTAPSGAAPGAHAHVAAVIVTRRPGDVSDVVRAVDRQVYEAEAVFVVSSHDTIPGLRDEVRLVGSVPEAIGRLGPQYSFIWLVDQDARPRPDALGALVSTADQVEASVVGSKILRADRAEELISVGEATDVFGHPFSGLETGERDQEQYDVIRDVAYVESASMLIRRDLAYGLGGLDPRIPYLASGLDLCQRARMAGGRVVIAPASEVLYEGYRGDRAITWREQAGRIRASLKVYSPITLLWSIPGLALIGLILAAYRTFNGRPLAVVDWFRAWAWNLAHLPTTLAERAKTRRSRQTGDDELFRYQVRGSLELRSVASQFGALIQDENEDDDPELADLFEQTPGFWQQPAFLAALFGVVFVLFFTRSLWSDGLPVVGYTLPLGSDPWAVLRAYAGGWHLGGLGSPEPMHPSIGATAAVHFVTRVGPALAATGLTIASVALGIGGTVRLLHKARISQIARYGAGVISVAGPAALAIAGDAYWPAVLAVGTLPWALAGTLEPLPVETRPRLGRIARLGLAIGWTSAMVPPLVVVPAVFGLFWSLAALRFDALKRGVLISALGFPFLFPWLAAEELSSVLGGGEPLHLDMAVIAVLLIVVSAGGVLLTGSRQVLRVGGIGAVLAAGGSLVGRSGDLGSGLEVTAAGAVVASIGMALVVGAALDGLRGLENAGIIRQSIARLGVGAGFASILVTLIALPGGRAGLAGDELSDALAFAESRADPHGADRMLVIGRADQLPGEAYRLDDGTAYRLVSGPFPTYGQAWLPDRRLGDEALEATIGRLMTEVELRPGAALEPFGVKWLVFVGTEADRTGSVPQLLEALTSQLDLRPLPQLEFAVLESELVVPRASSESGAPWRYATSGYVGEPTNDRILIRENADARWSPGDWVQVDWANQVDGSEGVAGFGGVPLLRLMARLVGLAGLAAVVVAVWGRPPLPDSESEPRVSTSEVVAS